MVGVVDMTTVTVACRIPNGIRIGDIVIHGPKAHTQHLENTPPLPLIVGGFVFNSGIDQAVWDRWFQANQNSDMVKNGMIYGDVDENVVRQKALGIAPGSPDPVPDAMAMIRQNAGISRR